MSNSDTISSGNNTVMTCFRTLQTVVRIICTRLVFAGCGAIVVDTVFNAGLGSIGISIVFGLIIMAMIYSYGNVSGAHFNPAVTLGFFAAKKIEIKDVCMYIVVQLLGAILGAVLLKLLFPQAIALGATNPSGSILQAFVFEVILTFLLMTVILNVSTGHMEKGIMAGIAIGGTVALAAIFGGPVCGASMNPARSIAPAIVSGDISSLWIYIIAPILGAVLAVPCYSVVQQPNNEIQQ